jgi:hypothetical protein
MTACCVCLIPCQLRCQISIILPLLITCNKVLGQYFVFLISHTKPFTHVLMRTCPPLSCRMPGQSTTRLSAHWLGRSRIHHASNAAVHHLLVIIILFQLWQVANFLFSKTSRLVWGPPCLLYSGYLGLSPGSKAAGAWSYHSTWI